jgi:DNA invertase Pin-like site-specific DNA recombinase
MGNRIGYARVSAHSPNGDSQVDELKAAGCESIFIDKGVSGKLAKRPQLDACLDCLRDGDTLVITRLSRAMRSLRHLLELSANLQKRGVGLVVLRQDIRTDTPSGPLVFHIFAAIDEFQRELVAEGTNQGLAAARARGRQGGRPPKLTPRQVAAVRDMYDSKKHTIKEIAETFDVSHMTIYRHLDPPKSGA